MRTVQYRWKRSRMSDWRVWFSTVPVLWLVFMVPWVVTGESKQSFAQTGDVPTREEPIVYKPPKRGAPESRVGGATRGMEFEGAEKQGPVAAVLAPRHAGLTVREQPTLYWFVSDTSFVRIEVSREVDGSHRTVLRVDYPHAMAPGINAFSFVDYNMLLEVDTEYRWSLIILSGGAGGEGEAAASGTIRRVLPHDSLVAKFSQQVDVPKFYTLAEEGVWYDAVDELAKAIAADPDDLQLRALRAMLMDQVDLPAVATYERQ